MWVAAAALPALAATAAGGAVCPDDLLNDTGLGGTGATAVLNVTDVAACCAACHGDYHDECVAWIWGKTGGGAAAWADAGLGAPARSAAGGYPAHNCAIMPRRLSPRTVAGHVSAFAADAPTPAPGPPAPAAAPCDADIDCDVAGAAAWRCEHDTSVKSNCHLAGPGTKGNSTCSCKSPKCSAGAAAPQNASATHYLMIGDSISLGMRSDLANLLKPHGWDLEHNPGNAASANEGAHCVADWLQTAPPASRAWDVISFQFGLHDIAFDVERISVEQYAALLTNVTAALVAAQQQSGAKLLWVTTTPVPTVPTYGPTCNETSKCLNPPRFDADVVLYNEAAAGVVAAAVKGGARISTLDLYSFVLQKCGGKGYANCTGFQLPANVHFTSAGWAAMAEEHAAALLAL